MKRLGYSFWGYCEDYGNTSAVMTPDGARYFRPMFVKELFSRGYEVIALQKQRENNPLKELKFDEKFPKLDCLFVEWRWSTYKNDINHLDFIPERYEPDLDRQTEFLEFYRGKIPIIILDGDVQMTLEDRKKYNDMVICEPCLNPSKGAISLPYYTDGKILKNEKKENRIIYVGNNYERYEQFDRYYASSAEELVKAGIEVLIVGNWQDKSVERPEQEEKVKYYKSLGIKFIGKVTFDKAMKLLSSSLLTVHITKQRYCDYGLLSPRYFECLACLTPGFMPYEMFKKINTKHCFYPFVEDSSDVIWYVKYFKENLDRIINYSKQQMDEVLSYKRFTLKWNVDEIIRLFKKY